MTVRGFRLFSFSFLIMGINIWASSFFTALNNGFVSAAIFVFENVFVSGGGSMFPSSDYRYRRSVDVRFGCRNDGFGGEQL